MRSRLHTSGASNSLISSAPGSTRTNTANSSLENYSPPKWLPPLSGRAARLGDSRILKPNALGTKLPRLEILWPISFLPMSSDRIIVDAIKVGQNLLSQNLPPAHSLTDAATVMRFRELVRSQAIRSALERSSDTFPAFVLREVGHVIADQSKTNRQIISRLWAVFDDPHLNEALRRPHDRRKIVGPH